jgi:hypothetical protein
MVSAYLVELVLLLEVLLLLALEILLLLLTLEALVAGSRKSAWGESAVAHLGHSRQEISSTFIRLAIDMFVSSKLHS